MTAATADGLPWPQEPFWDYAVALYGRPGVEAACLELQQRHQIDVNLVLLCLWLGERGATLDEETLARLCHAAERWQIEVVRPLRALRQRLKTRIADRAPNSVAGDWSELAASIRRQTIALELEAEHLEQLHLGRGVVRLADNGEPGPALACVNLRHYWRFDRRDRRALRTLLEQGFEQAQAAELDGLLRWLDDTRN
jgi:uncharacterized protein (TIGR02444 family)